MEPLGLRAHVLEQGVARGRIVGPARPGQDLGQSEDRRDRRAQFMADDIDERLAELPGATLLGEESIALFLETMAFGDVLPGAQHRDGPTGVVDQQPAGAVRPVDRPVGPDDAEVKAERRAALRRGLDRRPERLAIVGMDDVEIGRERRRRRSGLEPVLAEDRVGPGQFAGGRRPTPRSRSPTPRA